MRRGFIFFLLIHALVSSAWAHKVNNIFVRFDTNEAKATWRARIQFDAGYALPQMRDNKDVYPPKREWLVTRSPEQWEQLRNEAEKYLRECLIFKKQGVEEPLKLRITFPDFQQPTPDFPSRLDGGAYFSVEITGGIPIGVLELHVGEGDRPSFTVSIDGKEGYAVILPGDHAELLSREADNAEIKTHEQSEVTSLFGFLKMGFVHVLPLGLDHVLFILALFFLSTSWRPLLSQSLIFTVAHTVTLALAVTGVVQVSTTIVEPLIALSIACVAVENLCSSKVSRWRILLVFMFGLIHGLGFAGALSAGLNEQSNLVVPLIMMNLGVEAAQVTILLVCLVLFVRFAEKRGYEWFRRGVSITIAAVGLWWFVERLAS